MKLTLEAVAALTGGKILSGDPELTVFGVASLLDASREEASFLGNEKYFQDFLHTSAGIVLVPPGLPAYPEHAAFVEVDNPSMAFNALVKYFMASAYRFTPGIHPTAIIDPTASFNPDKIHVGAYTCIGAHCIIGDGTDIGNGCDIGDGVTMGENCRLHAHVTIRERCKLGNRVTIQPGAVIGSDGFGFLMGDNGRYVGIDQVGIVELGDDVDVGANTTIDRARFGRTIVGEGTKIDNLIQLGHNVVVGRHCIIVAQSGIAGSTKVGDYATIAAQVGISGHLNIGSKSTLGAKTGVLSDIPENSTYWGMPAFPYKDATRQYAALKKLPALIKEVRALKKELDSSGKYRAPYRRNALQPLSVFLFPPLQACPVPQRRCRNRSRGENRILSDSSPITTITNMMPTTWFIAFSSRPKCSSWPNPNPVRMGTKISAAIRERQAKAHPCFIPLTTNGAEAGSVT